MAEYMTPRDIDEFVDEIKTNYLECRVHGHNRTPSNASVIPHGDMGLLADPNTTYVMKTMRCRNKCGVVWQQIINMTTGQVVVDNGPDYSHAPLYLARGLGRLGRSDRDLLRLEQLKRWLEAHSV
jgi:hypothetical protein